MDQINWGIIGCGNVTEVKSGPAFSKVPHSSLVAVMRRNAEKAADYANRHNVSKWYADAQQLIDDPDVNAIYIATPPDSHEEYAIRAMQAGKPVYLEKPMALNAASAQRIADVVSSTRARLTVAHYRRQQPLFLKVKELLDNKVIGDINHVNLTLFQPHHSKMIAASEKAWRIDPAVSGGGLFHDLAPHQLDLMLYFFGKVKGPTGMASNIGKLYEAADSVIGRMDFENGASFKGSWCFVVPEVEKEDTCKIYGTKGTISFSVFEHNPIQLATDRGPQTFRFETLPHVQQPMIEKVVKYFRDEAENPCPASDGVEVMRVMDAFTAGK
jgi:predicted dehydrogenase